MAGCLSTKCISDTACFEPESCRSCLFWVMNVLTLAVWCNPAIFLYLPHYCCMYSDILCCRDIFKRYLYETFLTYAFLENKLHLLYRFWSCCYRFWSHFVKPGCCRCLETWQEWLKFNQIEYKCKIPNLKFWILFLGNMTNR